jgi:aldose 1-epimerase
MLHAAMQITTEPFGALPDGTPVQRWVLDDGRVAVAILTYGGIVQSVRVPDRDGGAGEVALGFADLAGYTSAAYAAASPYFGAIVGRYANRVARGRFTLDGREHALALNDPPNTLHGGARGFDRHVWAATAVPGGVRLARVSPDGEEGFPGALDVTVTYTLQAGDRLRIDVAARTDAPTVVNLTNHAYWNLAGEGSVLGHEVQLAAARFAPVDATLIPTGELRPVAGTPLDFREPHALGERIDADDEQVRCAGGYDHSWVLDRAVGSGSPPDGVLDRSVEGLVLAASVRDPSSGRVLTVLTDQPAIQLYSGNFLDGTLAGHGGRVYGHREGLALETQHLPDSPNQPAFPSTVLRPGETYATTTVYAFSSSTGSAGSGAADAVRAGAADRENRTPSSCREPRRSSRTSRT